MRYPKPFRSADDVLAWQSVNCDVCGKARVFGPSCHLAQMLVGGCTVDARKWRLFLTLAGYQASRPLGRCPMWEEAQS